MLLTASAEDKLRATPYGNMSYESYIKIIKYLGDLPVPTVLHCFHLGAVKRYSLAVIFIWGDIWGGPFLPWTLTFGREEVVAWLLAPVLQI